MTEAEACERLEAMRAELDRIDAELVALLGRRFRMIRDVAEHKRVTGIAVMQPSRVKEVLATRLARACEAGLDPKLVERLWTTIITHACQVENAVGGIEGGQLMFQGVSLDHARVEVDDVDAACEMICGRLSFERVPFDRVPFDRVPLQGGGEDAAILKGGDVILRVSRRAGAAGNARPADIAIQVHRLAAAVAELRRRGNPVEVGPLTGSGITGSGIGMATVYLDHPAHLRVRYVERGPGAVATAEDLHGGVAATPGFDRQAVRQ